MNNRWNSELCKCKEYFESSPVLCRLMKGFREKYASFGCVSGRVVLNHLTAEDIETLEGFFQKNYHGRKSVSISAKMLETALLNSRFSEVTSDELLECFFQGRLTSKKEEKALHQEHKEKVFLELKQKHQGQDSEKWLTEVWENKDAEWKLISRKYNEDEGEILKVLEEVMTALDFLPVKVQEIKYLAVFAAEITGDPHYFDEGTTGGSLLRYAVRWYAGEAAGKEIFPAVQKQKEYLKAGILKDDISNYTVACGVRAWKHGGQIHPGMEGFYLEHESVQISLAAAALWERAKCIKNCIYVVENPSVYGILSAQNNGGYACMCMNGQPKLASILVLELLVKSETVIYYAGDFDPEGLWIAQRLKDYFGENLKLWLMDEKSYESSNPVKPVTETRLKILERITDEELRKTAERMKKKRMAGYQENLVQEYKRNLG